MRCIFLHLSLCIRRCQGDGNAGAQSYWTPGWKSHPREMLLQADTSTALMFAARAGSMGAFTVLFLYTPEVRRQTFSPGRHCTKPVQILTTDFMDSGILYRIASPQPMSQYITYS